jgi:hypothetical protein
MLIDTGNGHQIHVPASGGKAGRGRNRTGTIQVRRHGFIIKQYRFVTADFASYQAAFKKAEDFCKL